MKIAILSPIFESVPPRGWGGVELMVYNHVEELINRGHQVTLFCAEGAKTRAKVITNGLIPANHDPKQNGDESQRILDKKLIDLQDEFDIIHSHTSHRFLYLEDQLTRPHLLTVHTMFRRKWKSLYRQHSRMPIISISKSQAKLAGLKLNFIATIYNGIDTRNFELSIKKGTYLAWIGRIVRAKGLLEAINIAKKLKMKLKFAGRFIYDIQDDRLFAQEIKKAMQHPLIEFIGEVSGKSKSDFLKNALVLVNSIQWDEPFGLVVPEANTCGTPVVAFARGAMPELIREGVNGFIVKPNDIDYMIKKIKEIDRMPQEKYIALRRACHRHVQENFTVKKMVDGYERVYKKVIDDWKSKNPKS